MWVAAPRTLASLEESLYSSKWASRAWTMQEFVLSRRCLIFTGDDYFLYCGQGAYVPGLSKRTLLQPRKGFGAALLDHRLPHCTEERHAHRRYARLVSLYACRHLSYSKDILRAFEGIAQALSQWLGIFRWGLPERVFRWSLCWMHSRPASPRPGFPSWSWVGWIDNVAQPSDTSQSTDTTLSFPDFNPDKFWPPCSVYYWLSPKTMKQCSTQTVLRETQRPDFKCSYLASDECDCATLRWLWNVACGERCSHRSYKRLLAISTPAFNSVPGLVFKHVRTFASGVAIFSEQHASPLTRPAPLSALPLYRESPLLQDSIVQGEPLQPHQHMRHYIFLGVLDHYSGFFAVIMPVNVDLLVPGTQGNADQLVVRRQGNPLRMRTNMWFVRARKCIVHYH